MAYAALISLENTIHRILNHHLFYFYLQGKQQIIISLREHVISFQGFLEEFPDKFNSLEGRMRELAHEAEDILEYFVLGWVSWSSVDRHELRLERVMGEIDLITREVEEIKGSCSSKDIQHDDHSSIGSSSGVSFPPIHKDAIVGFEDYVLHLKERLCGEDSKLQVIPICGMGGIGKTTLAKNVYDDPLIIESFDIRVWVTVSQDYSTQRILSSLLGSLKEFDTGRLGKTHEEKVYKIMKCRRYLVVMDDIWSVEACDLVRTVLPDDGNGSRVLLTTRLSDVASYPDSSSKLCEMQLMDDDQSWILFKKKVFGDKDCPSELQSTGEKIASSCGGLPLAIVVIAGAISILNRSLASWQDIAKNVRKSADQNQIEEILALSYFQLPQYLRPCFLYMGSFLEDEEIKVTKLIRLWIAEGFLKCPADSNSFEKVAEDCLEKLVKRNLVLVTKRKWDERIKRCVLHDMMRDLCIRKAHESNFFLNLASVSHLEKKTSIESMKNYRRVSINSFDLWHLPFDSTLHSIRCWIYFIVNIKYSLRSFRLLRVLDAEPADVMKTPLMKELIKFFHLRYLAITYYDTLKHLGDLQSLQTLVIHREDKVITKVDAISLKWCMPQLRHFHFDGVIHFCDSEETTYLGSLQTVSYVSHHGCTERILKKIPNLKKLKVDCSGVPHHGEVVCLNDLVHLHQLESVEVYAGWCLESRPEKYNFTFPKMLKKLILRDLELPWNDIVVVGSLPYLQVLKLKGCSCVGGTWETTQGEFLQLEFLLLEACNLENWITESNHFPMLKYLLVHSCGGLNEIPNDIREIPTLELIEVKGVTKESLVKSVEEIQNEQDDMGNNTLQVICKHEFASDDCDGVYGVAGDDAVEVFDDCASRDAEYGDDDNDEVIEELIHAYEVEKRSFIRK